MDGGASHCPFKSGTRRKLETGAGFGVNGECEGVRQSLMTMLGHFGGLRRCFSVPESMPLFAFDDQHAFFVIHTPHEC